MSRGLLVLEDGTAFEGELFGCECKTVGEVVFSTGMSGYQENITNPSSEGQLIIMSYPLIGNYGVNDMFNESDLVHARGIVVREYCSCPSKMFGGALLSDFLKEKGLPAISGIDTRELVLKLRVSGTMRGAIVPADANVASVVEELKVMAQPWEENLVAKVSCKDVSRHDNGKDLTIGVIDCGVPASILKDLDSIFNVIVFPYDTPAEDIVSSGVQGIIVSPGPGNPAHPEMLATAVKTIEDLSSKMPIYGIGLGSQLVGLAMGGSATKLKYGHHGANIPVKYCGRVYITAENVGFTIDADSLADTQIVVDQVNINDGSVEGIAHKTLPIMTSQYYPGVPSDCKDMPQLMERFINMVKEGKL